MSGLFFVIFFSFCFGAKNEFVVEKKINNHNDDGSEGEGSGGENELVSEREMDSLTYIVGEFVEWGEEAKKLGESGSDGDSEHGIPNEKTDD